MNKRGAALLLGCSLLLLGGCGQKETLAKIPRDYRGYYRASGLTVNIKNGGVNVTVVSALLDENRAIVEAKIDALLIPFQGMAKTTRPHRPTSFSLITDEKQANYEYVKDAQAPKFVNSKKLLQDSHFEYTSEKKKETSWAAQATRLENYLRGKDYNSFLAKVCSTTAKCENELTKKKDVPDGALLDFYSRDPQKGITLKLFKSEFDSIGPAIVEMFNSDMDVSVITENTKVTSDIDYEAYLEDDVVKVSFVVSLYEENDDEEPKKLLETIEDGVDIPLASANNMIEFTNTKTYVKFKKGPNVLTNPDLNKDYDADFVKSRYQK